MEAFLYFTIALSYSFVGSMPPASGNLLTIQLSITRGLKAALLFALGEVIFEFIYGYIAWKISNFIVDKSKFDFHLTLVAIPVFLIMSAYFFFNKKALEKDPEIKQRKNFTYGILIGFLNPLAIPFWVYNISLFLSNGWIRKDSPNAWSFLLGIPIGSFLLLYLYALLGNKILSVLKFRIQLLNRIIAIAFLLLAILQTIRLVVA